MDKILEKFGIYDFMGIWGPGAITVTYYLFISPSFGELFPWLEISYHGISQGYLLIVLYTGVSYTVGVLLHEIGKMLFERIELFDFEGITYFDSSLFNKKFLFSFKRIRYEYNQTIMNVKNDNILLRDVLTASEPLRFQEAISKLKYSKTISTKKIDKYHSIYALSRSLFVAFAMNILYVLIVLSGSISFAASIMIIIIDCILANIFFCRAYRYFLSWIKDTYVQYFLCIYSDRRKKDELN